MILSVTTFSPDGCLPVLGWICWQGCWQQQLCLPSPHKLPSLTLLLYDSVCATVVEINCKDGIVLVSSDCSAHWWFLNFILFGQSFFIGCLFLVIPYYSFVHLQCRKDIKGDSGGTQLVNLLPGTKLWPVNYVISFIGISSPIESWSLMTSFTW